nr:hypothetical protein Iba_chr06bCG13190 [Ipomoea batatas]
MSSWTPRSFRHSVEISPRDRRSNFADYGLGQRILMHSSKPMATKWSSIYLRASLKFVHVISSSCTNRFVQLPPSCKDYGKNCHPSFVIIQVAGGWKSFLVCLITNQFKDAVEKISSRSAGIFLGLIITPPEAICACSSSPTSDVIRKWNLDPDLENLLSAGEVVIRIESVPFYVIGQAFLSDIKECSVGGLVGDTTSGKRDANKNLYRTLEGCLCRRTGKEVRAVLTDDSDTSWPKTIQQAFNKFD